MRRDPLRGVSHYSESAITRVRAASLQADTATLDVPQASPKPSGPANFGRMGPTARLAAFRKSKTPMVSVLYFRRAGKNLNAIKPIRESLPCFSSALGCYFSFCELSATPAFPVSTRAIILRGAIFNDGRTFGNYANFAREAFFFLNEPTSWYTEAVANTTTCLRSAGKGEFRFPNFTRS